MGSVLGHWLWLFSRKLLKISGRWFGSELRCRGERQKNHPDILPLELTMAGNGVHHLRNKQIMKVIHYVK
ncbi:hypothetical protein CDAR_101691 [Caerostris darwini]|uniref:Uncharacterized protein n=1 Tax=Caerostris darwini TaxID=1538125 RepID=A0AAV4QSM9_9ARAC|nr:hypothetical protein CDAR_101691 [Caerostris darwini]